MYLADGFVTNFVSRSPLAVILHTDRPILCRTQQRACIVLIEKYPSIYQQGDPSPLQIQTVEQVIFPDNCTARIVLRGIIFWLVIKM
jgi:hypothetical protein